jgi:hypothetical protein
VAVAKALPGLGTDDLVPLVNPNAEGLDGLTSEDYFVLTRVDGRTTLHDVILICGLPAARALAVLVKLRNGGALYFKGETPRAVRSLPSSTGPLPVSPDEPALTEDCDLTLEQKKTILSKHASLAKGNLFDLLEVTVDVDKRGLRTSYFRLSKDFHPDRFYGKRLGSYHRRLTDIFDMVSKAWSILEDDDRREEYLSRISEEKGAGTLPPDDTTLVGGRRKN